MPPSDLINVREFRDNYSTFLRNQTNKNIFDGQEKWSEETKKAVADKCQ